MVEKSAAVRFTRRPSNPEAFAEWVETCLFKIEASLALLSEGHLPKTYVAPEKPYDGMVRYADGTSWNPGTGEGAYIYYAASWKKLG